MRVDSETKTQSWGQQVSTLSALTYAKLQKYIHVESGILLDKDKGYLLESRLLPILDSSVASSLGIHTLEELTHVLLSRPSVELKKLVVNAMTTNETLFFRDKGMFDALLTNLIPGMLKRLEGSRKLRIWSAASSSGQEAYSIAMILRELGKGPEHAEILGTDLSTQVIQRAREGRYTQSEMQRGLPLPYRESYFLRDGTEWRLCEKVRSLVRFEQLDLRREVSRLGRFDLILCRNVLIYFDTETRKQILGSLREMMLPEARLALGCAETIINVHDGFQRQQIGSAMFYSRS